MSDLPRWGTLFFWKQVVDTLLYRRRYCFSVCSREYLRATTYCSKGLTAGDNDELGKTCLGVVNEEARCVPDMAMLSRADGDPDVSIFGGSLLTSIQARALIQVLQLPEAALTVREGRVPSET